MQVCYLPTISILFLIKDSMLSTELHNKPEIGRVLFLGEKIGQHDSMVNTTRREPIRFY